MVEEELFPSVMIRLDIGLYGLADVSRKHTFGLVRHCGVKENFD
jgi:hypothetical protein